MVTKTKKKSVAKAQKTVDTDALSAEMAAQDAAATASSLEQVRNILFGEQVRQQNLKYDELQNELGSTIDTLSKDTSSNIDNLRKDIEKQLLSEQKDRHKVEDDIHQKLDELAHTLAELDSKLDRTRDELYDHIASESKHLSDQMHDLNDKAMELLRSRTEELQDAKMDREKLAEMFIGMASSISKATKAKS